VRSFTVAESTPRRPASLVRDPALPADFYHAVGYRLAGPLAVRADALV